MAAGYLFRKAAFGLAYRVLAGLELGLGLALVGPDGHNATIILPITTGIAAVLWSLGTLEFQDRGRAITDVQDLLRRHPKPRGQTSISSRDRTTAESETSDAMTSRRSERHRRLKHGP